MPPVKKRKRGGGGGKGKGPYKFTWACKLYHELYDSDSADELADLFSIDIEFLDLGLVKLES